MDEAGPVQMVAQLVVAVVESERAAEVERRAVGVEHRRRAVEVVHRLPVERGPQGRLPPGEVAETAAGDRHVTAVQEGERRPELPDEGAPIGVAQLDHRAGTVVAGVDDEAAATVGVRVRRAVLQPEGDGRQPPHCGAYRLAAVAGEPLGQLDGVEAVEVDRSEALAHGR
jgi:hypothetical protein